MFGLKDNIINQIKEVLSKYDEVERVVIFGSRATGNYKSTSDIDIAIFSNDISSVKLNLLRDDLDMLDIIYKIDVVHFNALKKQGLINNIINDGIEIFKNINLK
ncbi:MAG: nucleotidyltransferase domain-containing protein [Clostridium sp.]